MHRLRVAVAVVVLVGAWFGSDVPAGADAAGPTDYRSVVVSITPPTEAVSARIIGGDSFVALTVAAGHVVAVKGYKGEPYLRFAADGRVEENERAPTTYLNRSRLGEVSLPAVASADATPRWRQVATGGTWVWHDHRTHWMGSAPPLGRRRGDQILDGRVPIIVDGRSTAIAVTSTWMPRPSPWPSLIAVLAGVALAWWCSGRSSTPRRASTLALVAAVAALIVGIWEVGSVPSATGPSPLLWILPSVAVLLAGWAFVRKETLGRTALLMCSVCLVVWGILRLPALWRAVLPTTAPFPLDRAATGFTIAVAAVLLLAGLAALFRSLVGRGAGQRKARR